MLHRLFSVFRSLVLQITVHGCKPCMFCSGTKWSKIFTGPLWSHVSVEQTTTAALHSRSTNPIEVKTLHNV